MNTRACLIFLFLSLCATWVRAEEPRTEGVEALRQAYARLREEASRVAGPRSDPAGRAALYYGLYLDSGKNFTYPLIAAQVGLSGDKAWHYSDWLTQLKDRKGILKSPVAFLHSVGRLLDGLRDVSRAELVDTYTYYYFSKKYGQVPGAGQVMDPGILRDFNRIHDAARSGESLSEEEKFRLFHDYFAYSQRTTVDAGVHKAVGQITIPVVKALVKKPILRLPFFPFLSFLTFRDFTSIDERNEKGDRMFQLASKRGWDRVEKSFRAFRSLPSVFFLDPIAYANRLRRERLTGQVEIAGPAFADRSPASRSPSSCAGLKYL